MSWRLPLKPWDLLWAQRPLELDSFGWLHALLIRFPFFLFLPSTVPWLFPPHFDFPQLLFPSGLTSLYCNLPEKASVDLDLWLQLHRNFPISSPVLWKLPSTLGTFLLALFIFFSPLPSLSSMFGHKVFSMGQGHHCVYFFNLFFSQGWKIPKAWASDGWVSFLEIQWHGC